MSISMIEACARLGRRTRDGDFASLTMTEQVDLITALNAAQQRLFNALPPYFKEKTVGLVIPAPVAIASIGVVQFAQAVTGFSFGTAQFGQSVQLGTDPQWNQIIGPANLLNPYMGASGTVTGTIYGNAAFPTDYPFDHVIGNPQFADQTLAGLFPINMALNNGGQAADWIYQQNIGRPTAWWTQVFGGSQGVTPLMVMRFAPAPDQAYAIKVRLGFWPKRLTLTDYINNSQLIIPDQFIEPAFIKMALQEFVASPAWVVKGDEKEVDARGDEGESFVRLQVQSIGVPSNRMGTPRGY